MREIKFRAWCGNKMIQNVSVLNNLGHVCIAEKADFDSMKAECRILEAGVENLMQFTGLRDKNGLEIYEGDILGINLQTKNPIYTDVFWKKTEGCWSNWWPRENFEVVGNIWETPELLKEPSSQ